MKNTISIAIITFFILAFYGCSETSLPITQGVSTQDKSRIVVITDLGGIEPGSNGFADPDDTESMIHLLLCSNVVDIEGIISGMAWEPSPERTKFIYQLIDQFGEVLPNLQKHAPGYPTLDYLKSIVRTGSLQAHMDAVGEGKDTPGFLYFLANGLNDPEHWTYGGWGGRFTAEKKPDERGMGTRNSDFTRFDPYYMYVSEEEGIEAVSKWREEFLNDFEARMIWTTESDYNAVNHHPYAVVGKDTSLQCIYMNASCGNTLNLDASCSGDPDGDPIRYEWSIYSEPGSYKGDVEIQAQHEAKCKVRIPDDASGKDFHIILKVTDTGTPALTTYRRIVVSVK